MPINRGIVYLVGAGPGDPGLITVKGKECVENADVLIYDFLASTEILKLASEQAEVIYVGKKGGDHTLEQEKINELIITKAGEGKIVTRLKGGDPFIFGRGGEEAEELVKAGISFEVVPGVTSAIAAPAYAGIPLSHRKFASSIAFITGHENPEKEQSVIDWASLAKGIGTLVFLMGVKNLPSIVKQLKANGMAGDTPVALVRWGTTTKQKTITGTLDNIVFIAKEAKIKPPSVITIGNVVTLRDSLKWFEKRPLMGKRVLVTRARHQASELVKRLSALGAYCIQYPTIKVVQPSNFQPLDNALSQIVVYDWLIFTSVNGVNFFFDRLFEKGLDVRVLGGLKTASIGPATAKRLLDFGLKSDIVPKNYMAESVIEAFANEDIDGKRILIPRAKEARPILPVKLTEMGAKVDEVPAYCTKIFDENVDLLLKYLKENSIDLVTFTSSSTVKNFKAILPEDKIDGLMKDIIVASIGPITSEAARKLGFCVHIQAKFFTIDGLCEAITNFEF
mmetsp:Transcript_1751/g.1226  ORF Transcript_1751/g.1226 Transcript_1751/m.1226 type:complete len:508 (-) Transcript_1751:185-1708(-)|eukprot:CAMPEP_0201285788 /NCGR_PEP_ID=MMETSP1317-20130820/113823_1 /ASSEMBLY_ACC=CAM_ASM_000770 /TAXON_ID=187299 /ORGANISM="Undescribed Undescribed, Strain Undescribed" /LENGTH=507 /DNA_ID=CAMNT_0047611735 /DNA_START=2577 /DNA_END=4100 /DNA_ORIENTATION=+